MATKLTVLGCSFSFLLLKPPYLFDVIAVAAGDRKKTGEIRARLSRVMRTIRTKSATKFDVFRQIVAKHGYGKFLQLDFAFLATSLRQSLDDDATPDQAQRPKLQFEAGNVSSSQRYAERRRRQAVLVVGGSGDKDVFAVGQAMKREPSGATWRNDAGPNFHPPPRIEKRNGDGRRWIAFQGNEAGDRGRARFHLSRLSLNRNAEAEPKYRNENADCEPWFWRTSSSLIVDSVF